MKILKGILIMLLASGLTAGGFFIVDSLPGVFRETCGITETPADVSSALTRRIYALESGITDDGLEALAAYEAGLDKEVATYLKAHGGGKYTDSSGETHYVASSSGGGYSGGGSYYDDDGGEGGGYSGGSSGGGSSGGSYDDGPGYVVDVYVDDTEYNYCQDCGTHYIGTGGCPNPDCESYNP